VNAKVLDEVDKALADVRERLDRIDMKGLKEMQYTKIVSYQEYEDRQAIYKHLYDYLKAVSLLSIAEHGVMKTDAALKGLMKRLAERGKEELAGV
jgi:hypothetical protein